MGTKLHRSRRSMFKKSNPILGVLKWVIPCVAIVAIGFFGAKYLTEHPLPIGTDTSEASVPDASSEVSDLPAESDKIDDSLQAFYLPFSAYRNAATRDTALSNAAAAGFNAVILEMKDADGTIYFQSSSARVAKVKCTAENALPLADVTALFAAARDAGLQPIVHLYAFRDNAAARALKNARISYDKNDSWVWYDDSPNDGGKAWLNPYADEAHLYIIDLARELKEAGAAAVMLDGVQFPKTTKKANFGSSSNTEMSHSEILTTFVKQAKTMLGEDFPVIVACEGSAALSEETKIYGGNPLTFAPTVAAPTVTLPQDSAGDALRQAVQTAVKQYVARIMVLPTDQQPLLTPVIPADSRDMSDIRAAVSGCADAGAASFILYSAKGQYDFAALRP